MNDEENEKEWEQFVREYKEKVEFLEMEFSGIKWEVFRLQEEFYKVGEKSEFDIKKVVEMYEEKIKNFNDEV